MMMMLMKMVVVLSSSSLLTGEKGKKEEKKRLPRSSTSRPREQGHTEVARVCDRCQSFHSPFSPFANNNCRPAGRLAFFSVDVLPPTRYYMYVPAIVILRLFLILYLVHLFTGTVGSNNRF